MYLLLLVVGLAHLAIVRSLRYRRSNAVTQDFPIRSTYRDMTLEQAFAIHSQLAEVEFPTVFSSSVFFALFKTYGIPSISRLLSATGQLASANTASKRAADTGVILTEVVLHHPLSPRAIDGIARMNFLHGRYRQAGKISDEDMLYTLSLFALEPIRWTARFEWRAVNDAERCAMGTYWRWLGEAMEIPYTALESSEWTDGLHFLEELEMFSMTYETQNMVPAETNRVVAKHTIDIALYNVPKSAHAVSFDLVSALLEPRLRTAMKFDNASQVAVVALAIVATIRKLVVRHFCFPRPYALRKRWFSEKPNASGRFNFYQFFAHPWYIKPTFAKRWGFKAGLLRLVGGAVPGDSGEKYCSQGYLIAELGPDELRGKGERDMHATRERLGRNDRIGCPFAKW